jgi:hypothetical protein
MKRSVEILGGGVLGLVLGTVFLAGPIASAMSTYVRATWSLAGCPPGVYTLASTAQLLGGGPIHTATSSVRVPQSDVMQVFNNVPAGQYTVSASLRRDNGSVVGSAVQTVTTEDGLAPSTATRARTPSQVVTGIAGARRTAQPPSAPAVTPPATPTAPAAFRPSGGRVPTNTGVATAAPREWLIAELIRLSAPNGLESGWHQVQLRDLDGDGLVDEIQIEPPDGTAVVWRLVPQGLTVRMP